MVVIEVEVDFGVDSVAVAEPLDSVDAALAVADSVDFAAVFLAAGAASELAEPVDAARRQ